MNCKLSLPLIAMRLASCARGAPVSGEGLIAPFGMPEADDRQRPSRFALSRLWVHCVCEPARMPDAIAVELGSFADLLFQHPHNRARPV